MQYLRNEIFPAMSVNTDVSHQQFQPSDLSSWALRALRKGDTCDLTAIRKEFKLWGLLCVIDYSGKVKTCERFFSCCVSKQGCHTHQWLRSSSVGWVLGLSGRSACDPAAIRTAATPHHELQRGQNVKSTRILAQDSWRAYNRRGFSEPRLLHLPADRKALNFLRYLISINNFDVQTTCPLL